MFLNTKDSNKNLWLTKTKTPHLQRRWIVPAHPRAPSSTRRPTAHCLHVVGANRKHQKLKQRHQKCFETFFKYLFVFFCIFCFLFCTSVLHFEKSQNVRQVGWNLEHIPLVFLILVPSTHALLAFLALGYFFLQIISTDFGLCVRICKSIGANELLSWHSTPEVQCPTNLWINHLQRQKILCAAHVKRIIWELRCLPHIFLRQFQQHTVLWPKSVKQIFRFSNKNFCNLQQVSALVKMSRK